MNLVERVLYLYFWKEELAKGLGKNITNAEMTIFKDFGWWFESISFERKEPKIDDLVEWERKFAEIQKCLDPVS